MNLFQKINPEQALRLGLGLTYLYSGYNLVIHPTAWHWALPYWLRTVIAAFMSLNTYLVLQGIGELLLAFILLGWFLPRRIVFLAAILSTVEFFAILFLALFPFNATNFLTTFRDIGLLGAASALLMLLINQKKTYAG